MWGYIFAIFAEQFACQQNTIYVRKSFPGVQGFTRKLIRRGENTTLHCSFRQVLHHFSYLSSIQTNFNIRVGNSLCRSLLFCSCRSSQKEQNERMALFTFFNTRAICSLLPFEEKTGIKNLCHTFWLCFYKNK